MTRSHWIIVALLLAALLLTLLGAVVHLWSRFALTGIVCRRTVIPKRIELGGTARLEFEVENAKALPLPWLRIDAPLPAAFHVVSRVGATGDEPSGAGRSLSYLVRLAPNERSRMRFDIRALERGVHPLGPIRLRTADPFGFKITRSRKRTSDRIVVPPRRIPLEQLGLDPAIQWLVRAQPISSREAPVNLGDRRIGSGHDPSAGELGSLVEATDQYIPIVLILDLDRVSSSSREWLLSATASLATAALDAGYAIALETGVYHSGSRRRIVVRPGVGPQQKERVLDALAGIEMPQTLSTRRLLRAATRRANSESIVWLVKTGSGSVVRFAPDSPEPISVARASRTDSSITIDRSASPSGGIDQPRDRDFEGWISAVVLPLARLVLRISWLWPWAVLSSQLAVPGMRPGISLAALIALSWIGNSFGRLLRSGMHRSSYGPAVIVVGG